MEYLDYFDANHHLLGQEEIIKVYQKGLWHHTFHCWIFTSAGEVIFQLRSGRMKTNPNKLDISSAGHIQAGEDVLTGGLRELKEELGLEIQASDLIPLGAFQHACDMHYPDGSPNQRREWSYVYLLRSDRPLCQYRLQREELDGLYQVKLDDLFKLFSKEVPKMTITGVAFNDQNQLESSQKTVELSAFNPEFPPEHYLKLFIMIERALMGKKYLGV